MFEWVKRLSRNSQLMPNGENWIDIWSWRVWPVCHASSRCARLMRRPDNGDGIQVKVSTADCRVLTLCVTVVGPGIHKIIYSATIPTIWLAGTAFVAVSEFRFRMGRNARYVQLYTSTLVASNALQTFFSKFHFSFFVLFLRHNTLEMIVHAQLLLCSFLLLLLWCCLCWFPFISMGGQQSGVE